MIPAELAALTPARRAALIYAQAQSELSTRLWRAALGDAGSREGRDSPLGAPGSSFDSLATLLAAQQGGTVTANTPSRMCCCNSGMELGAAGAVRTANLPAMGASQAQAPGTAVSYARAVAALRRGGASPQPGVAAPQPLSIEGAAALGATLVPDFTLPAALVSGAPGTGTALAGEFGTLEAAKAGPVALSLGVNARHTESLAAASARTGIPAPALAAIVDAEAAKTGDGSWNRFSRNPRSSAAGLGQFLSGTWQGVAQMPGTWLNQTAQTRGWLDSAGRVRPEARASLLAMRYDATASIESVADLARSNLDRLERDGFNVDATPETLAKAAYLCHQLGLGDARRFLGDGLSPDRARVLLNAQVGTASASQRIARTGDATQAHRAWLLGYIAQHVRPEKFTG